MSDDQNAAGNNPNAKDSANASTPTTVGITLGVIGGILVVMVAVAVAMGTRYYRKRKTLREAETASMERSLYGGSSHMSSSVPSTISRVRQFKMNSKFINS